MDDFEPWGLIDARPILARFGPGDRAIAALAEGQEGMVTSAQLRFAGLPDRVIQYRSQKGRLLRVHRGVYAVGHRSSSDRAAPTAAILCVGPGALISHADAAAIQGILPRAAGAVHVTLPGRAHRSRNGIEVHDSRTLTALDRRQRAGLPVTAPARTILDLAGCDTDGFSEALNEARAERIVTDRELRSVIARNPGPRGSARLAAFLAAEQDPGFSRSGAEKALRKLIHRAGLPPPQRNVRLHGAELDFYWPSAHLNAETDGFATHGRRRNFESDRERDANLAANGIQVLRFTWWQLTREAPKVVARLAAALALRAGT